MRKEGLKALTGIFLAILFVVIVGVELNLYVKYGENRRLFDEQRDLIVKKLYYLDTEITTLNENLKNLEGKLALKDEALAKIDNKMGLNESQIKELLPKIESAAVEVGFVKAATLKLSEEIKILKEQIESIPKGPHR